MSHISHRVAVLSIVAAGSVAAQPAAAGPIFLPQPGYSVQISSMTTETIGGTGLITANVPVNVAYDAMGVDPVGDVFRQVAATADSFSTPLAIVEGSTTFAALQAQADLAYAVGVCALPGFPTMPVPVVISSAGSVSAEWFDSMGGGPVFAQVRMQFNFNTLFATAARADRDDPNDSDSFSSVATRNITAGGFARVSIQALGGVAGTNIGNRLTSGEFTAVIDPFFEIDPNATFLFNGQQTPFADAYTVIVSEGVDNQPPSNGTVVPEPSSLVLLALGMIGLCGYGRRRTRKTAA